MIAAACRSWLKQLFRVLERKPTCRRSRTWTLCLEPLEDRTLLSTFFVVNVGDTGSGCANSGDPRFCITQANATPGPNVIAFALLGTGVQLAPSVQTDKLDYSPGQTATITGSGFQAGETVDLKVVNTATDTPAGNPPTWTVVADTNGNIQTPWTCTSDLLGDTLQLSATGESSGLTASETFKDSNPTTTTVTASPNPSNDGQSVTFTATVTNTQSNSSPPGSVDFYDGSIDSSHLLGSGTLSGNGNSATATFATSTLSVGSHTIYAVYMPSANGFDSSTGTVTQNVINAAPSITSLGPNSAVEGSGAFTLTVNGSGFNQNSTVQWNNSALATTYDSSTGQLKASVPASDVAEEGTATVNVVNGGDDSSTSNTVTFTITDAVPTVSADQTSVTAPENQAASNTGTFSDYDDAMTITASTGTVTQNNDGTWSWSGTGDENSPYTVTITATNADGSKSTTSFNVSFTDVAPNVAADHASVSAAENQVATNTGTWSDFDDPVSLSASFGTVTQNNDGTWSWSGTGDKSNNGTVTITATNADGSTATTSFSLTFTDVAPSVSANSASVSAPENQAATNTGSFSDYDDDVTITASIGTVTQNNRNGTWSWSGTGDENSPYTVTINATNADGSTATTSFNVSFTDVAPSVAVTTAPTNVVENTTASASGIFSDHDDNVTLSVSEGNISQTGSTNGTWNWSETAPLSDGVHTVTITAKNSDGSTSSTNFTFTVTDVAPSVAVTAVPPTSVAENTNVSASGTFSDYDDPVTITASEGSIRQTGSTNGTWSWSESAPLSDGTHTVTITATNSDGTTSSTNFTFTVPDVAPSVAFAGNSGVVVGNVGQPLSLTGSFTDPDSDQWTGTVNYGDGSGVQPLALAPNHTFTLTHAYQKEGSYLVTVEITDDGGASGFASIPIQVYNAGVDLTQIKQATAASPTISDPGITATLFTTSATASLLLAPVSQNEVEQLGGGAFQAGQGTFTSAFDFRSVDLTAQDEVVATFQFPPGRTPALEYFDSSSQSFEPVLGSALQPNSLVIDPVHGTITLILDESSTPRLTDLTGTVFVVSIPQAQPSPPVVSPPPSPAPASAPSVAAEATTGTATFSTLIAPVFAQLSTPVVSSPSATESSAAAQEATTGTATLSTLSVPVLQSSTSSPITPANTQTASNNPSVNEISAFSPLVLMFTALHPGTSGGEANAGTEANLSLASPPDILSLLNRLPRAPASKDRFTLPDSGPRGVLSPSRAGFPEGADGAEAPGQAPAPIPTPPRNNPPPVGLRVHPTGHETTNEHETRPDEDHFGGATWLDEILSELIRKLTWHEHGSEGEAVPVHPAVAVLILGAGFVSRAAQRTMPLSRSRARSGID